jgi:hypothetical protein
MRPEAEHHREHRRTAIEIRGGHANDREQAHHHPVLIKK